MPIINLTEEELTKLWEAVNDGAEPPPALALSITSMTDRKNRHKVLQLDEVVADLPLLFRFEKTVSCNPDGHGGAGVCGGTLCGDDVATEVEVDCFLHQRWFSSRRHPLSGSEGSVACLVHKLTGENITGKNIWQE